MTAETTAAGAVDADCLFCRIIGGELPAEVVADTDQTVAFRDISPQAPTHVLVVPRKHCADAAELYDADPGLLADLIAAGVRIAEREGIAESGYRLLLNTGADAGQTVFHVHLHVLGGEPLGALVGGLPVAR
jgi:histidine triad (HIT) family protein